MLDLDMPMRTTRDWEGPSIEPKIESALNSAFTDDTDDINVSAAYVGDFYLLIQLQRKLAYIRFSRSKNSFQSRITEKAYYKKETEVRENYN